MRRLIPICLSLAGLAATARPASAQPPLCKVGASVAELIHLHSTGGHTRVDAALVGSSLIFLEACPASFVQAFREAGDAGFDPELRQAWIEAVRSAARDSSNTEVRGLLAVASESVARLGDPDLNEFLGGIFEGTTDRPSVDQDARELLFERQARATLMHYSACDAAGCFNASDNVLFLLGTHPLAALKSMHADSAAAARWLGLVAYESFSGPPEFTRQREEARRAVLRTVSETRDPRFEREQRACMETLRRIRFRVWD